MKIRHIAILIGLATTPPLYAQTGEQGTTGMNCPCMDQGQGQCGMPGQGMGCRHGMQWQQGSQPSPQAQANPSQPNDSRTFVKMPAKVQLIMRQDMLIHLATLTQILGLLADGKLNEAAEVAEKQMGNSARGKHRGTGMGPGRYMPPEMHTLGWNMHQAATDFAQIAKTGNTKGAYAALQTVTATCVTCHAVYRTR